MPEGNKNSNWIPNVIYAVLSLVLAGLSYVCLPRFFFLLSLRPISAHAADIPSQCLGYVINTHMDVVSIFDDIGMLIAVIFLTFSIYFGCKSVRFGFDISSWRSITSVGIVAVAALVAVGMSIFLVSEWSPFSIRELLDPLTYMHV